MIQKIYSKNHQSCRVTFSIPPEVNAQSAFLCGEFNNWDVSSHPMNREEDGGYSITILLKPGKSYCFRYYLGEGRWENDWFADGYILNEYGSHNSVVNV